MCRFLAYSGAPIRLEALVCAPCNSLIQQSRHASEGKTETNGDGFGIGWYGERAEPGVYRELRPAWSDENLQSLCSQVRSRLFFAHVRAATSTAITRANCHPFTTGRFMLMHNGQIGGWQSVRRRVEALIPDAVYATRLGTTDSEAILLAAVAHGLDEDPVAAIAETLGEVRAAMRAVGVAEPLRFTAALTDGERIWAFRWASDDKPPSLYWRENETGIAIVSEPVDTETEGWRKVPNDCVLMVDPDRKVELGCLAERMKRAA